jgi:hypothetical protein
MIIETSRPTRASRMRRTRTAWWPGLAIVMTVVVIGALIAIVH